MTLVLAVFNRHGAVLATDGLATWGRGVGAQQLPASKLTVLGDRVACGRVGDPTPTARMVEAVLQSPLATESTLSRPGWEWRELVRQSVAESARAYLVNAVFSDAQPIDQQFPQAELVVAGVAEDASFAFAVDWLGRYRDPVFPNYMASGSGAVNARIYLDAYSYFDLDSHPVLSLTALAGRVMDRVSATTIEIGGAIEIASVYRVPTTDGAHTLDLRELSDPEVRGSHRILGSRGGSASGNPSVLCRGKLATTTASSRVSGYNPLHPVTWSEPPDVATRCPQPRRQALP